jgi:hypothetical protein
MAVDLDANYFEVAGLAGGLKALVLEGYLICGVNLLTLICADYSTPTR